MSGGSQTTDQKPGLGVAEACQRATPVRLVAEAGAFVGGHLLAPCNEARAKPAVHNRFIQGSQGEAVGHSRFTVLRGSWFSPRSRSKSASPSRFACCPRLPRIGCSW